MTTARMPTFRSLISLRRAAVVLVAGAGVALSPLPAAQADASVGSATAAVSAAASPAAQTIVATALAQQGTPYAWGGGRPGGFDCSGLTQYAAAAAGISLPHSSRMQSRMGTPVSTAALQPGDLLFFYSPVSHVGIYIGNGQMVHAPSRGSVVKVVSLAHMPGLVSARRIA